MVVVHAVEPHAEEVGFSHDRGIVEPSSSSVHGGLMVVQMDVVASDGRALHLGRVVTRRDWCLRS